MTLATYPPCTMCHGSGTVMGGDDYRPCPSCRLRKRFEDQRQQVAEREAAAQRPAAYRVLLEQGWSWAALRSSKVHLVPPEGDTAACGRFLPRGARTAWARERLNRDVTCAGCRNRAGLV